MATLLDELSQLIFAPDEKRREDKKSKKVDMSSDAITKRLKTVDQLRTLCLSLMKAKKESDEKKKKEAQEKGEKSV